MIRRRARAGSAGRLSPACLGAVLGLAVLVLGLQALVGTRPPPKPLSLPTASVMVVGVRGLASLTPDDLRLPWAAGRPVAAAAVSEPARTRNECALSVWATLGAGRTTSIGTTCTSTVSDHRVTGWTQLQAASARTRPDAGLGTLAGAVPGCVAAVGPDAAVAAAHADGTLDAYTTLDELLRRGGPPPCPLTLVDPGAAPLSALVPLLRRPDVTVVLVGVRAEASAQAVEALDWVGSTPAGWLTSSSTRRTGLVTLPDLTRTLIAVTGGDPGAALPVDGALLEVRPAPLSSTTVHREIEVLQAQPYALTVAAAVLGGLLVVGAVLVVVVRHRCGRRVTGTLLAGAVVVPAASALTGLLPWQRAPAAGAVLVALTLALTVGLALVAKRCARDLEVPTALVAAAATVVVLTADAATGGLLQRASLLDLRPLDGGRWYGFGNTTFAVYAEAVLVVVGWLVARGAPVAAATLSTLALVCEASPSMGADLGGLLALAPPLAWLLLRSRGRPVGLLRLVAIAAAAAGLGMAVAVLDWVRGPQHRTHLGGFVQHLLDGSAAAVVTRKGDAALFSLVAPSGLLALGLSAACWWYVVRSGRRAAPAFPRLRMVVAAVAATAVLGTVGNDSGVVVGTVLSVLLALTVAALAEEGRAGPGESGPVLPST